MVPPTSIDGTDITGATIDGQDVQEITVDGQTVFSAAAEPPTAGLEHRWDFSDASTTTSSLDDLVGSADMTGSISGFNTINGVQSGDFDGSTTRMETSTSAFSSLGNHAIYVVFEYDSITQDDTIIGSFDNTPNLSANDNDFIIFMGTLLRGNPSDTSAHVARVRTQSDDTTTLDVSGLTSVSGDAGTNYPTDFFLGDATSNKDDNRHLDGSIGECLVYDHTASGYSRSNVESYFTDKWGITF